MSTIEVKVPDIGDFKDVPVIEVFVKPGDAVKAEDSLVTLESDKATMDVPAPAAGTVKDLKIKVGVNSEAVEPFLKLLDLSVWLANESKDQRAAQSGFFARGRLLHLRCA